MQAIVDALATFSVNIEVAAVISNKPEARGLDFAKQHGIATEVIDHRGFASREAFDDALKERIDRYQPQLVVLAGFMRILTPKFVDHYAGRMINIHPSLLPRFPGIHTHKRALDAGVSEHGASVHFVTSGVDEGPVIIQARVPVLENDDENTLAARVLKEEHYIFPKAVEWIATGRVQLNESGLFIDQTQRNEAILIDRYKRDP